MKTRAPTSSLHLSRILDARYENTTEQEKHRTELKNAEWTCCLSDDETYTDLRGSWIALTPEIEEGDEAVCQPG